MLLDLRSRANQMASTMNMPNFGDRESLLGLDMKSADSMSRTKGLDNRDLVGLQRQIIKGNLFSFYVIFISIASRIFMNVDLGMFL